MTFFSCSALNEIPLKCVSMNNQECKVRPEIININSNCNNIFDPYAKLCIPDAVKDMNFKVFNLVSRTNERRHRIKLVNVNKVRMVINADVNAKN